jgi:hypothetical protein
MLAIAELQQRQPAVPWLIPVRADDCEIPDLDIGAAGRCGRLSRLTCSARTGRRRSGGWSRA